MDKNPFFSIIIPTRNRHETLPYSIDTVLNQSIDNFELIVCDNCSSSETRDVINSYNSSKIRYVRSDVPLSMSDNWELALSHAQGQYVILLGDDDGLLPNCLDILFKLIQHTQSKVIRWNRAYYSWGSIEPAVFANRLTILANTESQWLDGKAVIEKVINMEQSYEILSMLYNAVLHISIVERTKREKGRFFHATNPDIFSGYLSAYFSEQYLSIGITLSVNGGSGKSNGTASMFKSKNNPISNDYNMLNNLSTIKFHPRIPFVRSINAYVIEPFLQFKDIFTIKDISLNLDKAFDHILSGIISYNEEEKEEHIKELLRCRELHTEDIKNKIDIFIGKMSIHSNDFKRPSKGMTNNDISLDTLDFNIHDVSHVCQFVENFYSYDIKKIIEDIKPIAIEEEKPVENKQESLSLYRRLRSAARIIVKGQ